MTKDSRTEILTVAAVGVFLAFLWFRGRANGEGNGTALDLAGPAVSNGSSNGGVPLDLTMPPFDAAGMPWVPSGNGRGVNVGNVTYSIGNPSACGCGGSGADNTYGSASDLAAGLLGHGYDMPFVSQEGVY